MWTRKVLVVVGVELVVFGVLDELDELLVVKALDVNVVAGVDDVEVGVIDLLEVTNVEVTTLARFV